MDLGTQLDSCTSIIENMRMELFLESLLLNLSQQLESPFCLHLSMCKMEIMSKLKVF